MRENELEKKMQEQMKGFGLPPSPEVWVEVEKRIRRERKRRFIFWWLLGIIAIGGGLTAFLLLDQKNDTIAQTRPATSAQKIEEGLKNDPVVLDKKENIPVTKNAGTTNQHLVPNEQTINEKLPTKTPFTVSKKQTKPKRTKAITESTAINKISKTNNEETQVLIAIQPEPAEQKKNADSAEVIRMSVMNVPGIADTIQKNTEIRTAQVADKVDTMLAGSSEEKKEKKKAPWRIGTQAALGRSSIIKGFGIFNDYAFADVFSSAGGLPSAGLPGNSSRLNPGLSFSTGLFAERSLSKKWSIQLGVDYNNFSSSMKTGNRVDSSRTLFTGMTIARFYRAGTTSTYTNRFHLLSFSAGASYQVLGGRNFKLKWDGELSYSRLIGSNLLHYSPGISGYYKDNSLLVKNHIFVSTGLSFPLSKTILLNPRASYSISPLLKEGAGTHFFNYGLRLKIFLDKN